MTWNKDKWPNSNIQSIIDKFRVGEQVDTKWKCGAYKKFCIGDRFFLSRTGKDTPGLIGSGYIVSDPFIAADIEFPEKKSWYVKIKFDHITDTPEKVIISHKELAERLSVDTRVFTPQKSGSPYKPDDLELEKLWENLIGVRDFVYPDEADVKDDNIYTEGAKTTVPINKYERNKEAREKCIEIHGCQCKACGINLGLIYGYLGKGYIHVHHIIQLKDIGHEYEVDPENDLVPLCPNCHAMIHQSKPALSVDALKLQILPRYRDAVK